jgi:hypothetical protein
VAISLAGIERYARFCAAGNNSAERVANWSEGETSFASAFLGERYDDRITDEIVDIAMRIEAEIAIHLDNFDLQRAVKSLGDTLHLRPDRVRLRRFLSDAERRTERTKEALYRRALNAKVVSLELPRLIEAREIAEALNITRVRKAFIWSKALRIRDLDDLERVRQPARTSPSPSSSIGNTES